jgi:3-methyladenine DNA glycosylase AlkC
MAEVPPNVLARLGEGEIETVNLMEWLAVDMSALARNVAARLSLGPLRFAFENVAKAMTGRGVTARLTIAGQAIAETLADLDGPDFRYLAVHASDIVRQWACYTVNSGAVERPLSERLTLTLPFAADDNMTVREAAWMAFRPHILASVREAVRLLEPATRDPNAFVRRFAIEATRPRSVWGAHCEELKCRPQEALSLLENVRQDQVRYVQLAVGNWLNDASKSRPEWVAEVCERWSAEGSRHTAAITRRGLRTLARQRANAIEGRLSESEPAFTAGISRVLNSGGKHVEGHRIRQLPPAYGCDRGRR